MWSWLLSLIGLAQDDDDAGESLALTHFLRGATIPAISAVLNPGVGGPALLDMQRGIEDEIRNYIGDLHEQIVDLKAQIGAED